MLEHRIKSYKRRQEKVTLYDQQKLLTEWRSRIDWIRAVPVGVERDSCRRVDRGMKAFFRRVKQGGTKPGFPRFKSRNKWRSFEVLAAGQYLKPNNRVYVTGIGPIKYRGMQEFNGSIKGIRVIRKARGWYVQLIVDNGKNPDSKPAVRCVGIDVGLTHFATLSNGEKIDNPRWYRSMQKRLKFLQRIVSRRKKGSGRRRTAIHRLAVFHEKIADTRTDWIRKLAKRIVDEYDVIAVENLNISGLAKTKFAKSILDAAWGQFIQRLENTAASHGVQVIRVDPRGTTQECSNCGEIVRKSLSDRMHQCRCGFTADRDHNAALNILRRVPPEVTRGECILAGS